ncbi:MAG TPA: hypothetical protein VFP17_07405 [Solirubrobacterales bacterium]|nr:hypothetical protein [Solirubrobacterales bacterium]
MVSARRTNPKRAKPQAAGKAERFPPASTRASFSLPSITLLAAIGLLIVAAANALSRATLTETSLIYWAGLLLIALPIFYRLSAKEPDYRERFLLVLLLGLALYGVKVIHDGIYFTFSDEFVHAFNAERIVETHHLYHFNPGIPTTPHYPGLEGATSALMTLTGMSSYGAGTILVGAARLTLMAALFFLFARLGGSARGAGLGVAIYTGSSNFLYWGAQFSYESLALPLMVVVLMAFTEREAGPLERRAPWTLLIVLAIFAITITHHLTSYGVALVFVALAILYRVMKVERPNPWPLALLAVVTAVGWLLIAARSTVGYLFPVLGDAIKAIWNTASGESAPRTLFHQSSNVAETTGATPLAARGLALLAVLILLAAMVVGIRQAWRRHRDEPLVLLFMAAAVVFFGALGLRFAPAAWETGNRAGEFLFIGLAFVSIYGAAELLRAGPNLRRRRLLFTAALGVVLFGGVISGWPWDVQLARPLRVTADGNEIDSESLALAKFAGGRLDGSRFAAPEAEARALLSPGGQIAFAGQGPDIEDIVNTGQIESWQLPLLQENHLPYVVADRRLASGDVIRGFYFTVPGRYNDALRERGVLHKFSRLPVARVWDSGRIVLYDLKDRP